MGSLGFRATFYDIIGYIIPGTMALFVGWAYIFIWGDVAFAKKIIRLVVSNPGFSLTLLAAAGYICGHAVNALSSFVIELPIRDRAMRNWKDWTSRIDERKLKRVNDIAENEFGVSAKELKAFDIRTRMEAKLPGPAITSLCFLSYYGMSWNLVALSILAAPIAFSTSLYLGAVVLIAAGLFWYQYRRFVIYYYDSLGSSLMIKA